MSRESIDARVARTIYENGRLTIIARRHIGVTTNFRDSLIAVVLGGEAAQKWKHRLRPGDPIEVQAQKSVAMYEFEDFVMPKYTAESLSSWMVETRDDTPVSSGPDHSGPAPFETDDPSPAMNQGSVAARLRERGLSDAGRASVNS